MVDHPQSDTLLPGHDHEKSEASIRGILWSGFALAVLIAAALGGLYLFVASLSGRQVTNPQPLPPTLRGQQLPPLPRVEANQELAREELLLQQRQRLSTYGWVDRDDQIAHIPIERAMQILAESPPSDGEKQQNAKPAPAKPAPAKPAEVVPGELP
jgi:hypothetical protein